MISPSAFAFLFVVSFVIPTLAYVGKRRLDGGFTFPRFPFYVEAIVLQMILLAGSFYIAATNRIVLFRRPELKIADALIGAIVLAVAVALMALGWRVASDEKRRRLRLILPATPIERQMWLAVAAAAAVGEEVTYRGVLIALLTRMTSDWWLAAFLASGIFALAHIVQGWRSVGAIAIFGMVFHFVVRATGGLYVAIVVHFLYDLIAGLALGRNQAGEQSISHETV